MAVLAILGLWVAILAIYLAIVVIVMYYKYCILLDLSDCFIVWAFCFIEKHGGR